MPRRGRKSNAARQREYKKGNAQQAESQMTDKQDHRDLNIANNNDMTRSLKVLSGTLHQGNTRFQCPGIQCTYISFLSLVQMTVKDPRTWTTEDIDACVIEGNEQFINHCHLLQTQPKMLMANELPESIFISHKLFECRQLDSEIRVGILKPNMLSSIGCEMEGIGNALAEVLTNSESCLVLCGGLTIAIAKRKDHFYMFDSHSRGKDGLLNQNGTAVLVAFASLNDLIAFIETLFLHSLNLQPTAQFEVVPLFISQKTIVSPSISGDSTSNLVKTAESNRSNCQDPVDTFIRVSKQQTSQKQDYDASKLHENASKLSSKDQQGRANDASELHDNALKSYFKDQQARENLFQETRSVGMTREPQDRKQYMKTYMKRKRKIEEFKKEENKSARLRMRIIRSTSEGKQTNKERSSEGMRKFLETNDARMKHNQMAADSMRKRLCLAEERIKHNKKSAENMRNMLADESKRQKHNEQSAESMRKMRKNDDKKEKLKEKAVECMKKRLSNEQMKQKHKEQSVKAMRNRLCDDQKRKEHRKQSVEAMKRMLKDEHKLRIHRKRNAEGMKKILINEQKKHKHNERSAEGMRNTRKRKMYNVNEHLLRKKRKTGYSFAEAVDKFNSAIRSSCSYVCTCCHQLWFKQSIKALSSVSKNIDPALLMKCVTGYRSVENEEWICNTCICNIRQGKTPKLSVLNGMSFPDKLPALNLNNLEERLISLRIPFMQIRALNSGGQFSLKGSVVNVPTDIEPTIRALPRLQSETETVPVKLKRMKEFKHAVVTENVRPALVLNALRTLQNTSTLYKDANITIDDDWTHKNSTDNIENVPITHTTIDDSDNFSEAEDEEPVMTFLDDQSCDRNIVISIAPGEGQRPLSIFKDPNSEYLSFPTLFCGQKRIDNSERHSPVYYSDICKWELRSIDRRVALHIPNLFYKMKKLQTEQVCNKVHLAVRRCKTKGKAYTAGYILKDNMGESLVRLDEGYRIFKTIRNSPQYWEQQKKDVFAMIRQLGIPTLFLSFSANDLHWSELIVTLGKLVDNKDYTDDVAKNSLSWATRSRLVQSDPVTCVRHFDHRVSQFIQMVLKSPNSPLGVMEDYFYRVEFQQRGSPHIHMLVWIKNSPKYGEDDDKNVTDYIDGIASCSQNVSNESKEYLAMQIHKHSRSCRKGGKPECRFGIPFPPMRETLILQPFDGEDRSVYEDHYKTIQNHLNIVDDSVTFDSFLQDVGLCESDYLKAIQTSIKNEKVFLKREPNANRINPYIKDILNVWKGNHDIQFVLDAYACAMYIVSYINKSSKGMSTLMADACKEARKGNQSLKQSVRHIGNKFLNAVEVSAQEAAYLILQQSMSQKSRGCEFIPTAPSGERTFLMKSKKELEALPDDSFDIEADNEVKRYARRHTILENYCLADFVSKVISVADMANKNSKGEGVEISPNFSDKREPESENEADFEKSHKLRYSVYDGDFRISLRSKPKIIRYVKYNKSTDRENYFREQLMLFSPWRSEETDILGGFSTYEDRYKSIYDQIAETKHQYDANPELLETVEQAAETRTMENFEEISPNIECIEAHDRETEPVHSSKYEFYLPETREHSHYDLGADIGLATHIANDEVEMIQSRCDETEFLESLTKLNVKQRQIFTHIIHSITFSPEKQLFLFITGGAGVGKSLVIRTLYQTLHRILASKAGLNPDETRIQLCAYTGLAAYNIHGSTLHSAFCIEPNKKLSYKPLSDEKRNTLQTKFMHLSVLIIDEVSMVGNEMLNFLNLRLQEIKRDKRHFGGVHLILVGDLFQLRPVGDGWIFTNCSSDYTSLAPNLWQEHFKMFELTEIMRQKDDAVFAELLNRIREGKQTIDDLSKLGSRSIVPSDPRYQELEHELHLFPCNASVDSHNEHLFSKLLTEKVEIQCSDNVLGEDQEEVKKRILMQVKGKKANDTGNLSEVLKVAVGLQYDTTHNVSIEDGICNGTPCVVKKIHYIHQSMIPSCIWVQFSDITIGRNTRKEFLHYYNKYPDVSRQWTPIWSVRRTFMFRRKAIVRQQFPLKPSSAKTVHKAQGQTKSCVIVDMTSGSRPHQHYVAFSRVTSLQGLNLLNGLKGNIKVDQRVVDEMERLRKERTINLSYEPITTQTNEFRVVFQNAQSLRLHLPQIQSDSTFTNADVVCLAETRLYCRDHDQDFSIEGYLPIIRNDQICTQGLRPPHGLAMYVKQCHKIISIDTLSTKAFECLVVEIQCSTFSQPYTIVVVYKSPTCSLVTFEGHILSFSRFQSVKNLVIVGDFNFDVSDQKNARFLNLMKSVLPNCHLLNSLPTTWEHTKLDLCFTTCKTALANIIACVWSYHHTLISSFF